MSLQVPKRYYISIALFMLTCAFGALGAAAYFWLHPLVIVVGFVLAGVLPMAFHASTASLFLDPTKTKKALVGEYAPKFVDRFRLAVVPVLFFGALGTALVATWFLQPVRHIAIDLATSGRFELSLQRALWDDDGESILRACEGLHEIGASTGAGRLFDLEERHGDDAFDCILQGQVKHASPVDMRLLGGRFASEIAANTNEERACILSERLRLTAGAVPAANLKLLECSLNHQSIAQRTCCSQSISSELTQDGAKLVDLLPAVGSKEARRVYPLLNALFRVSFGDDFKDERVRQTTRIDDAEMQSYLLETLCDGAQRSAEIDFVTAGEHLGCGQMVQMRSADTARIVCNSTDVLEPKTFCGRIESARTRRAKERGQRLVWQAIGDANSPDGGQRIWRGLAAGLKQDEDETGAPDWTRIFNIPNSPTNADSSDAVHRSVLERFIKFGKAQQGSDAHNPDYQKLFRSVTKGETEELIKIRESVPQ